MSRFCIAVVTDDGRTISTHFGRAKRFVVFTVEDGRIVAREERTKPTVPPQHDHSPGAIGGRVRRMVAAIPDCRVIIAGGMGRPAYHLLTEQGYQVYLTGGSIEEAVQAYLEGRLSSDMRRLHEPGHHHHHEH